LLLQKKWQEFSSYLVANDPVTQKVLLISFDLVKQKKCQYEMSLSLVETVASLVDGIQPSSPD
jgi:hypothetical protein